MNPLRLLCYVGVHWARYESQMIPGRGGRIDLAQWLECERCGKALHFYPHTTDREYVLALYVRSEARARAREAEAMGAPIFTDYDRSERYIIGADPAEKRPPA